MPVYEDFISKGELKASLDKATTEKGVPVAMALIGTEGVILAAKLGKPMAVSKELLATAKAKKHTLKQPKPWFGTALIDPVDGGKLRFMVNKDAPAPLGLAVLKVIKLVGYTDLEFVVDPALETEGEDGQEGAPVPPAAPEAVASEPEPAPVIPDAPPPPADMSGFRTELTALIPQIPVASGGDAAKADEMKKAATAVTLAIRATDPDAAKAALETLKKLVGQGAPAGAPAASPTPAPAPKPASAPGKVVAMQKSRLIWESARKKVGGEVQSLKAAVTTAAKGDAAEAAVLGALGQLDEMLEKFDERLLDKLDALLNEGDAGKHAALLSEAKGILGEYAAFAQSSPLVAKLDGDTPFGVKLSVATTMGATLKALQATIV